ncbi:MAG: ABC transporter ATP-binding protein [Rubrivivax sp.]
MTNLSTHTPHSQAATAELAGVSFSYPGGEAVLKALDWALPTGQIVGLLGRNGSGKTTLLETLLGLREPRHGQVRLFGQDAARLDDAARARIGYVPQHSDLFEAFSPAQLLAYFRSFYPRWNEAKVEGLLTRWDIGRDKPIGRLSTGQQQRLSIIRALAHEPDLLVLDEPVASLDPVARRDFLRELVEQVLDRGTTVVFSTHILSDLERVAFHLAFLSAGRIALQAPLDELLDQVRAFTGSATELASLLARLNARPLARKALEAGRERVLAQLPADTPLPAGLAADRVTLDDLYEELTG